MLNERCRALSRCSRRLLSLANDYCRRPARGKWKVLSNLMEYSELETVDIHITVIFIFIIMRKVVIGPHNSFPVFICP